MRMHREQARSDMPPGLTMFSNDPRDKDLVAASMRQFMTIPPSQLPPEFGMLQRQSMEMQEPFKELEKAPEDSLSPELQQLKLQLTDAQAQLPDDSSRQTERLINELLQTNGEPELPFDELKQCLSPNLTSSKSIATQKQIQARFNDSQKRKPDVFMAMVLLITAQAQKEESKPKIDLQFKVAR